MYVVVVKDVGLHGYYTKPIAVLNRNRAIKLAQSPEALEKAGYFISRHRNDPNWSKEEAVWIYPLTKNKVYDSKYVSCIYWRRLVKSGRKWVWRENWFDPKVEPVKKKGTK